jgi:hypothetical protein
MRLKTKALNICMLLQAVEMLLLKRFIKVLDLLQVVGRMCGKDNKTVFQNRFCNIVGLDITIPNSLINLKRLLPLTKINAFDKIG